MTNPYLTPEPTGPYGGAGAGRPGGLTAVCVIAIVLGGLGLIGSLGTIAGLAAGSTLQKAFTLPAQGPDADELVRAQRALQQGIQGVTDRYWWPNLGFALVNLGLAGTMIAGGLITLNHSPQGRTLLMVVFAIAVLFEIARSVVTAFMQLEVATVMSDLLPRMMEASGPVDDPNAQQVMSLSATMARVGALAGLVFQLCLSVAKLIFYVVGWAYLCRPAVRDWLEPAAAEAVI